MSADNPIDLSEARFASTVVPGHPQMTLRVLEPGHPTTAFSTGAQGPDAELLGVNSAFGATDEQFTRFIEREWHASDSLLIGVFNHAHAAGVIRLVSSGARDAWLSAVIFDAELRAHATATALFDTATRFTFQHLGCARVRVRMQTEQKRLEAALVRAGYVLGEVDGRSRLLVCTSSRAGKLGLGTVNFGLEYGSVPGSGQVSAEEALEMVQAAMRVGITRFDTATQYGTSEAVLGQVLEAVGHTHARVVSKLPMVDDGARASDVGSDIARAIDASLARLRRPSLDALLVHRSSDLTGPHGRALWHAMEQAKAAGLVARIGFSIYTAEDLAALPEYLAPDVVQLPLSVADPRLAENGSLAKLDAAGVEIHVRSVFLQGVLLARLSELDGIFDAVRTPLTAVADIARNAGVSPSALCLGYAASRAEVGCVMVGSNSRAQLDELVAANDAEVSISEDQFARCAWHDPVLLNPAVWPELQARAARERSPEDSNEPPANSGAQ